MSRKMDALAQQEILRQAGEIRVLIRAFEIVVVTARYHLAWGQVKTRVAL
jgi:hypothetical protein